MTRWKPEWTDAVRRNREPHTELDEIIRQLDDLPRRVVLELKVIYALPVLHEDLNTQTDVRAAMRGYRDREWGQYGWEPALWSRLQVDIEDFEDALLAEAYWRRAEMHPVEVMRDGEVYVTIGPGLRVTWANAENGAGDWYCPRAVAEAMRRLASPSTAHEVHERERARRAQLGKRGSG